VLDGQQGSDSYQITARGGPVTELSTAYDSGTLPTETDTLTLIGTQDPDTVLLRAMGAFYFPSQVQLTGNASNDGLTDKIFKSGEPDKLAALLQAIEDAYGPHDIPAGTMDALITLFANHVRGPLKGAIDSTYAVVAGAPTKDELKDIIDDVL